MSYAEQTAAEAAQRAPTAHLPHEVTFEGRTYTKTGKVGTNVRTGQPSAEYGYRRPGCDRRLWMLADGTIEED